MTIVLRILELVIDKFYESKKKQAQTETELAKIDAEREEAKDKWRVQLLSLGGWWFQALFVIPLGIWFASVVLYSIFFHAAGPFPMEWNIAALPEPLDEWAMYIIAYLFLVSHGKKQ